MSSPDQWGIPVAEIDTSPLQVEEGVFFKGVMSEVDVLPLPAYDTVVNTEYRKPARTVKHSGIGTTYLEEWEMSDGIRNDVLIFEPKRRRTDIIVAKNTAWGTQVRGFNEDVARKLMEIGLAGVVIGPEKNGSIPLSQSAHNTHQILDTLDSKGHSQSKVAAVEGYSRGAMIGFGTAAYAAQNAREIVYSNLTDPCLAHPMDLSPRQLLEALPSLKDAPAEYLTSIAQFAHLAVNPVKLFHYRESFDITPKGLWQFYRTGLPLFTGEAGYLAKHFPLDSQATLCFFRNSLANHQAEFKAILKDHPGVEFKHPRGGHIQGMDKRVLGNIAARFSGLVDQLASVAHHSEIDYTKVHRQKSKQLAKV